MAARRIDILLVELGHFATREKAQRAIMAGCVFVGTDCVKKSSQIIRDGQESTISLRLRDHAVSRAYYKLQKALDSFGVRVDGRLAIDVGASTGGFTQLLLERGARHVWAIDCGINQLDWLIRNDPRVTVMEKTNARHVRRQDLEEAWSRKTGSKPSSLPDLAVMDVSFISVNLILPVLSAELGIAEYLVLVKPQFEAGRAEVGAGGIVRDPATHRDVLVRVIDAASAHGLGLAGLDWSPITGGDGNIEFLAHFIAGKADLTDTQGLIAQVVEQAHASLRRKAKEVRDEDLHRTGL